MIFGQWSDTKKFLFGQISKKFWFGQILFLNGQNIRLGKK